MPYITILQSAPCASLGKCAYQCRSNVVNFSHPFPLLTRHCPGFEHVMRRKIRAQMDHLEPYVYIACLPRGTVLCGAAVWPSEMPGLLPTFQAHAFCKPVCISTNYLSSQPPELFNACHLLFYVQSVSAAYNQEPSLISRDYELQFIDKEVELWVRGHKQKSPLLENLCIKK